MTCSSLMAIHRRVSLVSWLLLDHDGWLFQKFEWQSHPFRCQLWISFLLCPLTDCWTKGHCSIHSGCLTPVLYTGIFFVYEAVRYFSLHTKQQGKHVLANTLNLIHYHSGTLPQLISVALQFCLVLYRGSVAPWCCYQLSSITAAAAAASVYTHTHAHMHARTHAHTHTPLHTQPGRQLISFPHTALASTIAMLN